MASTSSSNEFFGWDLLYKTVESKISQKSDILIALSHFMLIKHCHFRCVGVGEDKTITDDEIGSELLPVGWNDDVNKYALRYAYNKELYLLFGQKTEDCIIINLLNVKTKKVSNIALEPELMVKETKGSIYQLMPTASLLADRIRKELITPVFTGTTKEVTTQTTTPQQRSDPLRVSQLLRPLGQFPVPVGVEPRPFGFPDVGRGDLDPLGRGGPGNLLPFPSRPDFRAGLQPAFPRFDPFGPPEPNIRPNPNPDHLQPPNFGHDYYM